MRRTILVLCLLTAFMFSSQAQEQPVVTWDGLVKQKEKSDEDINHHRKGEKVRTWSNRGKLYYDIAMFNFIPSSYVGLPAEGGIQNVKYIIGEPDKIEKTGEKTETWVYPHKKLYMKNGALESWEETDYIDKNALEKSAEAYIKAKELDDKERFINRSSTKTEVMMVRNALMNKGVEHYSDKEYEKAYDLFINAGELGQFPKDEKVDTAFHEMQPYYYAAVVASEAEMFDKSRKLFKKCVENNYNGDMAYHNLAETYLLQEDSITYIKKIKEGFDKYPESEQLVIDMINYYMVKDEPDQVIKYIDIALKKNPDNPSLYSAKATVYDNQHTDLINEYKALKDKAHEAKKEAFRNRFDEAKKKAAEKKRHDALATAKKLKTEADKAFNNALEQYKLAIEKDPKFFNPVYNMARLHYKTYEEMMFESEYAYKVNKDAEAEKKYKELAKDTLKKAIQVFEQALEIKPNDRKTIELLSSIYFKLQNYDKADEYKEKLNSLPKEGESGGIN